MNKKPNSKLTNFYSKIKQNERILLVVEVALTIIFLMLSIWGRCDGWNEVLIAIFDGVFTAFLLAVAVTIVTWGEKDQYKDTLQSVTDIKDDLQNSIDPVTNQLGKTSVQLQEISDDITETSIRLKELLGRNCLYCKSCLVDIYPNRRTAKLDDFFKRARRDIRILVTNLNSVNDCIDTLIDKAEQGVSVKICTIDARDAYNFHISSVTGDSRDPKQRFDDMKASLGRFLNKNKANHMQIKTYSRMPTIICFIVDDECILAYILDGISSRNVVHMHFKCDETDIAHTNVFKKHFDGVFEDNATAKLVTAEDVQNWEYPGAK